MDSFDLENARLHAEQEAIDTLAPNYAKALKDYGALGVIAMFLVWWMASGIATDVRMVKDMVRDHVSESNFYLRAICVNGAHDEKERANCVVPERR